MRSARIFSATRYGSSSARRRREPAIATALIVLVVVPLAVAEHTREPYYHLINDREWDRFTWIQDNVNASHDTFLAHPWKEPVPTALTNQTSSTLARHADHPLSLPHASPERGPLVFTSALHLLSYWTAKARGLPIDKPRNLAKTVTVE